MLHAFLCIYDILKDLRVKQKSESWRAKARTEHSV